MKKKKALITFVSANDPNFITSKQIIFNLPNYGADIIEIGLPFSDPMADGPIIQRSYVRALKAGCSLIRTFDLVKKFNLDNFSGTHAIGHTRMATESAITTDGSHPYSTGEDECLVHNGSLSNHNNLRRKLKKSGSKFSSDNDTEVAAGYISDSLKKRNLKKTLNKGLNDLDGFYTFIAGTHSGFAVLRDEIACKPAVIAETKDYVAISSEFQAMAHLPNVNNAKIFEPEPGIVYSWGK